MMAISEVCYLPISGEQMSRVNAHRAKLGRQAGASKAKADAVCERFKQDFREGGQANCVPEVATNFYGALDNIPND